MRDPDESALDDPDRLAAADPDGYLRELAGAGAQVRRTAAAVAESGAAGARDDLPRAVAVLGPRRVVDAVLALDAARAAPIVPVSADAGLPRWVGAVDHVVAVSAAGDDGAMAAAAADAGSRGARVVGVCPPDTPLAAAVAHARGAVVPTAPARWARLGLWPSLIGAAGAVGVVEDVSADSADLAASPAERAAAELDEVAIACRPDGETVVNPAKQLAVQLAAAAPVVLSTSALSRAAAQRFAEMAMAAGEPVATTAFEPGLALGLVGGPFAPLSTAEDIFRDPFDAPEERSAHVVALEDVPASPGFRAAVDGLARSRAGVTELAPAEGADPLRRLARWVATLDFAAAYLAVLNGVDPGRRLDQSWRPW